jgi:RNA polymerase sigma factor (TIGR02999 family)
MHEPEPNDQTEDLLRAAAGDGAALERVYPLVYRRVRELAGQMLAGDRAGRWVQASSLVQRAMIRLLDHRAPEVLGDGARLTGLLATIMRRIVIDIARRETAQKRRGSVAHVSLHSWQDARSGRAVPMVIDALEVEDSLVALTAADADAARVAEMRLWGGMEIARIAAAMDESESQVRRLWNRAKAWLARDLSGSGAS